MMGAAPGCSSRRIDAVVAPIPERERRSDAIDITDFKAARPKILIALTQVVRPETRDDPAAAAAVSAELEKTYGGLLDELARKAPLSATQLSDHAVTHLFENPASDEPRVYRGYDTRLVGGTVYGDILVLVHKDVAFAFYRANPDVAESAPRPATSPSNFLVLFPSKILFDREDN
jgi:hypothetical protein